MKGVQCYELFGGIALKIHTFSFFSFSFRDLNIKNMRLINVHETSTSDHY